MAARILWADDEIDQLKAHILFLKEKGFDIHPVTNGSDALEKVKTREFDLVFLDEQMPGMDGLQTLEKIKEIAPLLPVVMITKSEEESIMEDAIGRHISDYLIKPVNPNQILLTVKRVLERRRIQSETASQLFLRRFGQLSQMYDVADSRSEWIDIYRQLLRWEHELREGDETLQDILADQMKQANAAFSKYVVRNYREWLHGEDKPILSPDVFPSYVFPHLDKGRPVVFILIDCMRYDQWQEFERHLSPLFQIETDFYYSILPTATPYSRNAIFSGLHPARIKEVHPDLWDDSTDENSLNRHEEELLSRQLRRHRIDHPFRYRKVLTAQDGRKALQQLSESLHVPLSAYVYNFVDTLVHSRSDSDVLKELAPDARAFRSVADSWFQHSTLLQLFRELASSNATVVVTTDHGSIRAMRDTLVYGDRHASVSLRYKHGRSLKAEDESSVFTIDKPQDYLLPHSPQVNSYLIALEDYYFVYPTQYHKYQNKYRDTFQHGGISMEEMILPVSTLTPRSTPGLR